MSSVFKGVRGGGLIRGVGVGVQGFVGMWIICVVVGVWIDEGMYGVIVGGWYAMRGVREFDEGFFEVVYVRSVVKGDCL